ncbi:MAG TPA: dienelactone hydrolase family protein [Caldimonas sp.]|jgi:carboxymethylenebutenolidase|nr:dienelactone hydrolase family protein [Caldimonas sp.]HEX2539777.1 dienelactone hydrolase family protein [Caldimonas sp.]
MLRPDPDLVPVAVVGSPVGSGYAKAAQALAAQAIATPVDGLVAGPVSIASGDFAVPAYRACREGAGPFPVVLVVSEIFGVHEYIADVARRFARLGYLAIAPELFVRQGDAKAPAEIPVLFATIISKVPDEQVMADLDACVAWAGQNGGDLGRLAVTGFCWGGRITWLYAAHSAAVKAGVAWYGRLTGPTTPLQPRHPVDVAGELKAPVLGLYGDADTGIPLDHVDHMKASLAQGSAAAKASQFVVYPRAQHAFHADYRPNYDETAARDGWQRCVDWLRAHGVA